MKTSYKPCKLPAIAAQVRKEHPTSSEIKNILQIVLISEHTKG